MGCCINARLLPHAPVLMMGVASEERIAESFPPPVCVRCTCRIRITRISAEHSNGAPPATTGISIPRHPSPHTIGGIASIPPRGLDREWPPARRSLHLVLHLSGTTLCMAPPAVATQRAPPVVIKHVTMVQLNSAGSVRQRLPVRMHVAPTLVPLGAVERPGCMTYVRG
jgi:hypothetical protein